MIQDPPATGSAELNSFLVDVKNAINTATKPLAGWKLSDFEAGVSEVISDKRDLIDIVTAWDELVNIRNNFETEVARYETIYSDSKVLGNQYQEYADTFSQIMEWWDQNVRLIEDIEAFMIKVEADTSTAVSSASAAKTSETKAKTSETNAKTSETKAKTSETNAKTSETKAKTSETNAGNSASSASNSASSASSSASAAAGSASQASSSKSAAASSASAAASSASASEGAAVRAEAGATTVGNAQAVLTARDQAVTAKNGAVTAQTAAETAAANAATVATAKAIEEVNKLKAGAPAAFDTLLEIANELGENETERAALTNSIAAKADKAYVDSETARVGESILSRGQQAVVNGNGQLGGKYWSNSLTFVPTDAPTGSFGSWENPESQVGAWNSREIVIDPTLPTYMSTYVRQAKAGGSGRVYLALSGVDQDGNDVTASHVMYVSGTLTTLAQDLKAGDTVVHLTSSENWVEGGDSHNRRIIFWNYVSASGKEWGPETYSRNVTRSDTWLAGGVNHATNTITLAAPWDGDPVPAGTPLSNGNNGSNYMYPGNGIVTNESWGKMGGTVAGKQDFTGRGLVPSRGWPPGVAAVRPGILLNQSTPSTSNVRFANVYVSQLAPLGHTHTIGDVTGLEDALTAAGTAEHTHTSEHISDATDTGGEGSGGKVVKWTPSGEILRPGGDKPSHWESLVNRRYVDQEVAKKADTSHTHTASQISDATTTGRSVLTASSQAAARTAIGAGTSNLALGTTSSTAKAGNYQPTAANISDATTVGRNVLKATDAAAARTAIGAGTSNLALGTTSSTAKAGDYQPTAANISDATTVGRSVLTASSQAAARTAIGAGTSSLALGTTSSTAAPGNHTHSQYAESSRVTALEGSQPIIVSSLPASPLPGRIYYVTG